MWLDSREYLDMDKELMNLKDRKIFNLSLELLIGITGKKSLSTDVLERCEK